MKSYDIWLFPSDSFHIVKYIHSIHVVANGMISRHQCYKAKLLCVCLKHENTLKEYIHSLSIIMFPVLCTVIFKSSCYIKLFALNFDLAPLIKREWM